MAPRIAPIDPEHADEETQALLERVRVASGANIFTTLVRHPDLFRRWIPFGGALLSGALSARDRELLILRTGFNCGAEYEWAQHVLLGRAAGLTDEEIERVARRPLDGWPAPDRLLLQAADELHQDFEIAEDTWAELAERYDTEQLIEVPMLVGHYHLVAMTLRSLQVELDEGLVGFPSGSVDDEAGGDVDRVT
jgi:alkylhydroperoxidase family enzyme